MHVPLSWLALVNGDSKNSGSVPTRISNACIAKGLPNRCQAPGARAAKWILLFQAVFPTIPPTAPVAKDGQQQQYAMQSFSQTHGCAICQATDPTSPTGSKPSRNASPGSSQSWLWLACGSRGFAKTPGFVVSLKLATLVPWSSRQCLPCEQFLPMTTAGSCTLQAWA